METIIDFTKVLNKGDTVIGKYGWPQGQQFKVSGVEKNYFSCSNEQNPEVVVDIHTGVGGKIEYDMATREFTKYYSSTGDKAVSWSFPENTQPVLSKASRGIIKKLKEENKQEKQVIPGDLYTPAKIAEIYGWDGKKIRKKIRAKAEELGIEKSDLGWALTKEQVKQIFGDIL